MATSAAVKLAPAINDSIKARLAPKQEQATELDIKANPIYQAVTSKEPSEQIVSKLTEMLAPDEVSKAKESLKALEEFKEFAARQRIALKKKMISLISDKVFAQMANTYASMNGGFLRIRDAMKPMTETLEALFTLRTAGGNVMVDTFEQIEQDRNLEEDWDKRIGELKSRHDEIQSNMKRIDREVAGFQKQTGWLGGVSSSAQREIAARDQVKNSLNTELAELQGKAAVIAQEQKDHDATQGKFKAEKLAVRKMLDIAGPEHEKQMRELLEMANEHIENTQQESAVLRENLIGVVDQADDLVNVNDRMVNVIAMLDKSLDQANGKTKDRIEALAVPAQDEDTLARIERERKKNDFERHVSALTDSCLGTKTTLASLEKDAVDANTFRDGVVQQQSDLREAATDGIGDLATGIHSTIFAINTSALNETQAAIRESMRSMNAENTDILNKAVIKAAVQLDDTTKRMMDRVESLASVRDSMTVANQLREQGMLKIQDAAQRMVDTTAEMRAKLQESIGMDAALSEALKDVKPSAKTEDTKIEF